MSQVVTTPISIDERSGDIISLPVAANVNLFAGQLIAITAGGQATFAADTAGLKVIGRAEFDALNGAGVAGELNINAKRGVFKYANAGAGGFTSASQVGAWAYVHDDQTVAASGTTNSIKAGVFLQLDADGGVWIDTRPALYS
jgi:hypothetical protein